jgi:cytochrome P450
MVRLWVDDMLHREEGQTEPTERVINAAMSVYGYTQDMVVDRRAHPGDDLVSALIEAELDDGGTLRRLTDQEIVGFVILLNGAGVETVARLLSFAAVVLARNPDQRQLIVDDPSLVPNAIEELLRYEAPSPVNGRWTTQASEFHGITIPAESKVLLINGSANRDPREYDDPDTYDVRRSATRHTSFGYGAHFCLGAALARLEARLGLAGTLARFPTWEIDDRELEMVRTTTVRGFSVVPLHFD